MERSVSEDEMLGEVRQQILQGVVGKDAGEGGRLYIIDD